MDENQAGQAPGCGAPGAHLEVHGSRAVGQTVGDLLAEAGRLTRAGEPAVLCTVVEARGSCPRGLAARMIVYADGAIRGSIGGGALEADVIRRCLGAGAPTEPVLVTVDLGSGAAACGGSVTILLEPLGAEPRLVIFGAGHIALELAAMARRLGLHTTVVDDRPDLCSAERFPGAARLLSFDPASWSTLVLDRRTYAVVVTRDHALDLQVVRALIGRDMGYVGMIGSRRKVAAVQEALRADGVSQAALARLHAPIGLDIGAETPAEIAISILAEIVSTRRSRTP
jgi:xanthine dehydrogenase accessory factor